MPGSLTSAEGEVRYIFNQAGEMLRIENHDGNNYIVQAEIVYNGLGQRIQAVGVVQGVAMTNTYTLDGTFGRPLAVSNSTGTTLILYGQYALGEYVLNAPAGGQWQYYLGDGELSVRQLTHSAGKVTLTRTYAPYGLLLQAEGRGDALYGYAGGQSGTARRR